MSPHLSDAEFVDHAEGALAPSRAAHLAACADCREEADAVARVLATVKEVPAAEPSPLYWEHLSTAIRQRVSEPATAASPWWLRPVTMLPVAALVVFAAAFGVFHQTASAPARVVATASPAAASVSTPVAAPAANDAAWELLASTADDANLETAGAPGSEFSVRPSSIDSAVLQLSPAETEELGRLLQDEIKRSGA